MASVVKTGKGQRKGSAKPARKISSGKEMLAFIEEFHRENPDFSEGLPSDLSRNLDHYLYGAPKKGQD